MTFVCVFSIFKSYVYNNEIKLGEMKGISFKYIATSYISCNE